MENASKALLITAGVLIVILIVNMGIKILSPVEGTKQSAAEVGQSLSDKTSSAIESIFEERIPETPKEYFSYYVSGNEIYINGLKDKEITKINIPSIIDGKEVTRVQPAVFKNNSKLIAIKLPDTITYIGHSTFYNCKSLKTVYLPKNLKRIESQMFQYCTSLKQIKLPNSITEILWNAFDGCSSLEEINIPNGVTSISNDVFQNCTSLKRINIPSSVTKIWGKAFCWCTSLEEVVIPSSVQEIKDYAFLACSSLKKVTIYGNPTIGTSVFPSGAKIEYVNN